eukprot:1185320-Pleurochrysis_carterae.AAC.1
MVVEECATKEISASSTERCSMQTESCALTDGAEAGDATEEKTGDAMKQAVTTDREENVAAKEASGAVNNTSGAVNQTGAELEHGSAS